MADRGQRCRCLIPLFHQGSLSAGSEPEPSFKPVLCLSTPKAPALNQQKRFVSKHCWARRKNRLRHRLRQGLGAGLPWTTRRQKLWTAIFEIAAKHGHVGFAVFGCRCRFAKPWTSITTQRPPLLIVCLGLFGMDRRYADRSVRGIGVLRERLESWRLFMLLDRSRGALSVLWCRSICVARCTSNKSVVFGAAALVKRNMKRIQWRKSWLCIGSLASGKATGS